MNALVELAFTDFMMNVRYYFLIYFFCFNDISFRKGKTRFNIKLWKTFIDCFNCLPVAAIIDEKIFCCHGGKYL